MGIDGISLLLVVLTTFLFPISLAASGAVKHRVREYAVAMLLLEAGIIGVFLALDLLVFFVFAMQCMSTLAAVKRETGGWRWPAFQLGAMSALAYLASLLVFQVGKLLGFS